MTDTQKNTGNNLVPRKHCELIKDHPNTFSALDALACATEETVVNAVNWYLKRKELPKWFSQWLRILAIILVVIGGMVPLVSGMKEVTDLFPQTNIDHWGYLFLVVAGALLGADYYMGFSSTWMRFMTTQMALQRALEQFQLAWAVWRLGVSNQTLTAEQQQNAVTLLTNFQKQIGDLVDKEFQTWLTEFQQQLAALRAAVDKGQVDRRPGTLVVTYRSHTPIAGLAEIYVDDQLSNTSASGGVVIGGITPGSHIVMVKANGGALYGKATANVEAGKTAQVDIELTSMQNDGGAPARQPEPPAPTV